MDGVLEDPPRASLSSWWSLRCNLAASGPNIMSQRCPVGLGSVQAWYQFLPPPRTFCTLSLHEAGRYRAPGGTQDPLHQRSLTVFPRVSSWYLMAVSAIASRSVHPSLFVSPWPTMKAVMLNDVTGRRMLSTSSPDPLMSVTCTRGEPAHSPECQAGPK